MSRRDASRSALRRTVGVLVTPLVLCVLAWYATACGDRGPDGGDSPGETTSNAVAGGGADVARTAADRTIVFDLTLEEPRIDGDVAGKVVGVEQIAPSPRFALDVELADPVLAVDRPMAGNTSLEASGIRSLEHPPSLRLAWQVEPPPGALFTFRPLHPDGLACSARHRVTVRPLGAGETGSIESIHDQTLPAPEDLADDIWPAAEVTLDLSPWQGRRVELVLSGDRQPADGGAPGRCASARLAWGSPMIWTRGHSEAPTTTARPPGAAGRPNLLLLGLDTVRADHLGAWGRSPSPTPALDRLAAESHVFLDTYSTFNVTGPSFASMFTGLYGKHHGSYNHHSPVADEITTLAERLHDTGYATSAVVSAWHLSHRAVGLGQGFDRFESPWGRWAGEEVVRRGLLWLASWQARGSDPFFQWLHFYDAHTPHMPPRPFAFGFAPESAPGIAPVDSWSEIRPAGPLPYLDPRLGGHPGLYLGELAYLDRQLGRLLDVLDQQGLLETTWVVVVADHGENLGEHGIQCRHIGLWDTTTHVPLMLRPPGPRGGRGTRHEGLVQTVDLFPTVLRLLGLDPSPSDGRDLFELVAGGGRDAVFAEHAHNQGAMIRTARHLLYRHHQEPGDDGVWTLVPGETEFFDLASDPLQEVDLSGRGFEDEAKLRSRLDAWLAAREGPPTAGPERP